ncbi:unnamed protein product, partial [Staurois parvus]
MLLPRSRVSHGSYRTASHCCCLYRHTLHVPLFRSPHTVVGFNFVIGCWQITGLPLLLPGPVICHGPPLYRLLMLLPGSSVSHGSLYGLPLLLSPSPHSACATCQVSLTPAGVGSILS